MRFWLRAIVMAMAVGLPWPVLAGQRTLAVGVENIDYYPCYGWDGKTYHGAAREILDAFAADKGYRLEYRPLPVKRLYAELFSGGIDLKFPDDAGWAADLKKGVRVIYSHPVMSYIDGVLVRPERVGRPIAILGTIAGFDPFPWRDRIQAGSVELKENPRMALLLRQVLLGRIDGAYLNVAVATHMLEADLGQPAGLVFDPSQPYGRSAYRVSSVSRPDVVAEFDSWLAANTARVEEIKRRYQAEKGVR